MGIMCQTMRLPLCAVLITAVAVAQTHYDLLSEEKARSRAMEAKLRMLEARLADQSETMSHMRAENAALAAAVEANRNVKPAPRQQTPHRPRSMAGTSMRKGVGDDFSSEVSTNMEIDESGTATFINDTNGNL